MHRSLGLSYEEERRRLKEEIIDEAIFTKEQQILGQMRLAELISLDPDKAIPESAETPDAGGGGIPGVPDDGGGMGDMGGMGVPPGPGPEG